MDPFNEGLVVTLLNEWWVSALTPMILIMMHPSLGLFTMPNTQDYAFSGSSARDSYVDCRLQVSKSWQNSVAHGWRSKAILRKSDYSELLRLNLYIKKIHFSKSHDYWLLNFFFWKYHEDTSFSIVLQILYIPQFSIAFLFQKQWWGKWKMLPIYLCRVLNHDGLCHSWTSMMKLW